MKKPTKKKSNQNRDSVRVATHEEMLFNMGGIDAGGVL